MIDLHMHFDGSLPVETVLNLARKQGIRLPADTAEGLTPYLKAPVDCKDLNEYLMRFDIPQAVLQTREALAEAAGDLARELQREGLLYAEFRFAPQFHTQKGLTQREAVEAVLAGLRAGCGGGFFANLILCCMRGTDNQAANQETIRIAAEEIAASKAALDRVPRVVLADLAGAEAVFPTEDFRPVFELAKELSVPYTLHAGEAAGAGSVRAAVDMGAVRIGHGVRCVEDEALVEELAKRRIPLECCVTSNLQTRAFESAQAHPLLSLYRKGLAVTVNTDNMTVSQTTIAQEFALLSQCGMTGAERDGLLENACRAAWLRETEREWLRAEILKKIPDFFRSME